MKLVECVPNFSEGKNLEVLNAIADVIKSVKGITLLDMDPGAATNRTVFTFVGEPQAVEDAAFLAIEKAQQLIDMRNHTGEHARQGATDVCPFIPVSNISMEECVEIAKKLGTRVGKELNIPVFLYEKAATKPERVNLANIRAGEYEALEKKLKTPEFTPDYGPAKFDESVAKSGATCIGAREFLIAYNINLNTRDQKKAHDIALDIREKGKFKRDKNNKIVKENGEKMRVPGLFKHCKAVGWFIDEFNRAQISMNLTNYKETPVHIVLDKVRELAQQKGIQVTGSEIVGLLPKDALLESGKHYLKKMDECLGIPERKILETAVQSMGLEDLGKIDLNKKVIEYAIASKDNLINYTLNDFCDELSSDSPAPGGGSVAALCSAISGSLTSMVSNLTIDKKGYEKVKYKAYELAEKGQDVKEKSLLAIDKDTQAFYKMMDAMRLPKKTEKDKEKRDKNLQEAIKHAILVPLETIEISFQAVKVAEEISKIGNKNAISDAGVAAITANAAAKSAFLNVKINMGDIADTDFKNDVLSKAKKLIKEIDNIALKVEENILNQL